MKNRLFYAVMLDALTALHCFVNPRRSARRTSPFLQHQQLQLRASSTKKDKDEEKLLIPEENPNIDPNKISISGVVYGSVVSCLNELYPPDELSKRNAISRSDGYWAYIEAGEKPPSQFTYGEFDILFFAELLDKCNQYWNEYNIDRNEEEQECGWDAKTFLDIGSGTGRLVVGCAALHPRLELCKGLEILPGIHRASLDKMKQCRVSVVEEIDQENNIVGKDSEIEFSKSKGNNIDALALTYDEPLCQDMTEMQQALQEMSTEEWKALLGDDYSNFFEDVEDTDEQTGDSSDIGIISDEIVADDVVDQDTAVEEEATAQIKMERSKECEITEGYILSSDDNLVSSMGDSNEDEGEQDHQFESLEDFLELTQQEWIALSGSNRTSEICSTSQKCSEPSTKLSETNDDDQAMSHSHALSFGSNETRYELPLAPISFSCGSFQDPYEYIGDADIVFVFSSCMTQEMMGDLSDCIGRQLKPGVIVITTEFTLHTSGNILPLENDPGMPFGDYEIELLDEVDGWNWITDKSTAYIQRVKRSLWDGEGPRVKPRLKLEEVAFKTIRDFEAGNLTNIEKFMRQVRNNMLFHSIPDIIQTQLDLVLNDTASELME
jgi:hypothetical protein